MTPYTPFNNLGYPIKLHDDIELLRNCYDNDCLAFSHEGYNNINLDIFKQIGDTTFLDNTIVGGESILVSGFLKNNNNSNKINYNNPLIDIIDVSWLCSEAIYRHLNGISISELYNEDIFNEKLKGLK